MRYLLDHSEHHLVHPDGMLNVDLHWALALQQFALPLSQRELWNWLKPQNLGSREVLGFSPEELLLVLCINGTKDCWRRLDRVCDVAELLQSHPKLDWPRVFHLAGQIGSMRMLCVGLKLAAELLGSRVPHAVMARVTADAAVVGIVNRVRLAMFGPQNSQVEEHGIEKFMFEWGIRDRLRDRIRYALWHLIPTVGDWAAVPLPSPLKFLHYMIRPIRLLGRVWQNSDKRNCHPEVLRTI